MLTGSAKGSALAFVDYLRANGMLFEREGGYWEDKYYWGIKYKDAFVCFILINNEELSDPEAWTVWSDDSGANTIGDGSADENTKDIFWKHVVVCENAERCFDGCQRSRKTILGKEFENVCGTALKFDSPTARTVASMKKMVEIRKAAILASV